MFVISFRNILITIIIFDIFNVSQLQRINVTSRVRHMSTINLQSIVSVVDVLNSHFNVGQEKDGKEFWNKFNTFVTLDNKLDLLLKKIYQVNAKIFQSKNTKLSNLRKSINNCDASERESMIKIMGIPPLSTGYYLEVLRQLANQIGVKNFSDSDVLVIKKMNSQPNFVHSIEVASKFAFYPILLKFNSDVSKLNFIRKFNFSKMNGNFQRFFICNVTLVDFQKDKVQVHGFHSLSTHSLYKTIERICDVIKFAEWNKHIKTLFQNRYTKKVNQYGIEELQTEGFIVKLRTRKLKSIWMRKTRLTMLEIPKAERKKGFHVNLNRHVKYKHINFTTYIDEHLSTHKKNLFLIARARCATKNWLHCWTWDGNIFVRRRINETTFRLNCFEDIDKYIK